MFYLIPAMPRITRRHLLGDHPTACRHNVDHSSRHLVQVLGLKHPGVLASYIYRWGAEGTYSTPSAIGTYGVGRYLRFSSRFRGLECFQSNEGPVVYDFRVSTLAMGCRRYLQHPLWGQVPMYVSTCVFPILLSTCMTRLTE
jgi:hypothetical protein